MTWPDGRAEYESTPYYFYSYTASLDQEAYRLMPTITQLPTISVFLTTDSTTSEAYSNPTDTTDPNAINSINGATYHGENIEPILKYLRDKVGLNSAAAIGVLANIYVESAFDPQAVNDRSQAYGLCQWLGGRKANLLNYCKNAGINFAELKSQLKFLKWELESDPSNSGDTLPQLKAVKNSESGAKEAARIFCDVFERPGDSATTKNRMELAEKYWAQFGGQTYTGIERTIVLGGSVSLKSLVTEFTPGSWKSSKTDVATVSSAGKVKALAAGSTTITAYSSGAAADKMKFKITVKKISLSGGKTKRSNEEFSLADCLPDSDVLEEAGLTATKFASSDEKIFVVDEGSGIVTPKKNGEAKLKVTFKYTDEEGNLVSAGTVSTTYKLKKPYLKATSVKVKKGKKAQFTITNENKNVTTSFQSEDPSVAEIVTNAAGTKFYVKAVGEKKQSTYVYLYLNEESEPNDKIKVTVK